MGKERSLTGAECRAARRDELGVSQQQLAKEAGVSRTYVTNFENGSYEPTDAVKAKLRAFFEKRGVDLDRADPNASRREAGSAPISQRAAAGRLRGPECIYISAKLANESQRDRILERIFEIGDRLEAIGPKPAEPGFLDLYDGPSSKLIEEGRALIAEAGLLYARLFGREFSTVPTAPMLANEAPAETIADALGLVFRSVFEGLKIRRNAKRSTEEPSHDDAAAPGPSARSIVEADESETPSLPERRVGAQGSNRGASEWEPF